MDRSTKPKSHEWKLYKSYISGLDYKICQRCGSLWEFRGQWDGDPSRRQTWDWDKEPASPCNEQPVKWA